MKAFRHIATAVVLAVGIAFLISWIGELDGSIAAPNGEPAVVFSNHHTRTLSQETIVDELDKLKLSTGIRRVDVGSSRIDIDLQIRKFPVSSQEIFADVAKLSKLALAESDNIHRVFIRVLIEEGPEKKNTLLIAVAGARNDYSERELQRLRDGEEMPESWLKEKMVMTETDAWRELVS